MFIDGRTIAAQSVIETDIAIIGAGAAGITLARELAGTHWRVALIESGSFDLDDATQALYEGESGAVEYPLAESRLRYFGGTTNHWGGWCRPLMPIDFEGRPAMGIPAWPFGRAELDPYYRRAADTCQLNSADFDDAAVWQQRTGKPALDLPGDDIVTRFFLYSPPTRFGEAYRDQVDKASNVTTYLNSNVLEIVPNAEATRIERLAIATLGGNRFEVRPRLCILATGGIENARLLLTSDSVQSGGLANGRDLVGRYFMEHVTPPGQVAAIAAADETLIPFYYTHTPSIGRVTMRAIFMPSDAYLRRESRFGASLSIYEAHAPGDKSKDGDTRLEPGILEMLRSMGAANGPAGGMIYGVACATEPQPSAENRVTLTAARDALGMRKARLTWRPTQAERDSLYQNLVALARSFGGWQGAVKVAIPDLDDWQDVEIGWGNHHMGTTRMAADPSQGVVDADCKAHGLANLYIAGSSVFPSCGPVNPTLTIVALAMRLADHLKAKGVQG
ncbi:MAG TPA: GMC family oxidoreductase [Dongiaceae bacterium]|nr:GMC family oxidoreductase [Dongiaceae bacterium]